MTRGWSLEATSHKPGGSISHTIWPHARRESTLLFSYLESNKLLPDQEKYKPCVKEELGLLLPPPGELWAGLHNRLRHLA